ncbi:MAG: methyltransferase domain-containing protein, partial [Candidatus Omnitrophota bacterium]
CSAINFDTHICGYNINRINHMYGKQLDHFSQPDYKMRLFRKEKGRFVQPVHEYVKLEGEAGHLKNPFIHYSIANFAEHWQKTDLYTRFEVDITRKRYGLNPARCLVEVVFKPPFRLLQNYILLKGFREGLTGLVISVNASLAEFLRCFRCLVASFRERKATKTWSDFYNEPADTSYYWENITIHKDFLGEVLKSKPNRILEIGAGSGTLSVFLNHMGSEAIAVDKDKAVLERAEEASRALNGKVKFEIADAFNLPYEDKEFDVSFSQGVLEHFQDEDIVRILKEQTRVAKAVFFSVPNKYYNHRDFGNERLLTKEEWEKILSNFKITLSKYYYIVRAKRNFLTKLPIMYMAGIK